MAQAAIAEMLLRVHAAFDRHGIWHVLHFGTLLGAIREGDVIEWDHDLDLLVRREDVPAILALNDEIERDDLWFWEGKTLGVHLRLNPGHVPCFDAGYLSVMDANGSCGEAYAPTLFADGVLRLYDLATETYFWPQSSVPAWFFEETSTAEVRGVALPVPRDAEALLGFLYGEDWRTPQRAVTDGGEWVDGRTEHGDVGAPNLAEAVAWCLAQGWDRDRYAGLPEWPRPIRAAGPYSWEPRTVRTSGSCWWHDLDELAEHY
jgi:hypothetical protein